MANVIASLCTPRCEGVDARGYPCMRGEVEDLLEGNFETQRREIWRETLQDLVL